MTGAEVAQARCATGPLPEVFGRPAQRGGPMTASRGADGTSGMCVYRPSQGPAQDRKALTIACFSRRRVARHRDGCASIVTCAGRLGWQPTSSPPRRAVRPSLAEARAGDGSNQVQRPRFLRRGFPHMSVAACRSLVGGDDS